MQEAHGDARHAGQGLHALHRPPPLAPVGHQQLHRHPAGGGAAQGVVEIGEGRAVAGGRLVGEHLHVDRSLRAVDERHHPGQLPAARIGEEAAGAEDRRDSGRLPGGHSGERERHGRPRRGLPAGGELPVHGEDLGIRRGRRRVADAHADLLDVGQRPPVHVLAAQEDLAPVDDEVLGVEHAAHDRLHREAPHHDAGPRRQAVEALRVPLGERGVDEQAHRHPAIGGRLDGREDGLEPAPGLVAHVELGQVERARGRLDHGRPDVLGVGDVGVVQARLDGRRLHQGEVAAGARDRGAGGRTGDGGEQRKAEERRDEAGTHARGCSRPWCA